MKSIKYILIISAIAICCNSFAQEADMSGRVTGAYVDQKIAQVAGGADSSFVMYFSAQHGTSGWQGWSVEGANAQDWTTTYGTGTVDPVFVLTRLPLKVAKPAKLTTVMVCGIITSGSGSECETEIWKIDYAGGETTVNNATQIAGGTYSTSAAAETVKSYLTITAGDLDQDDGFYIVTRRVSGTGTPYLSFTLIFNE